MPSSPGSRRTGAIRVTAKADGPDALGAALQAGHAAPGLRKHTLRRFPVLPANIYPLTRAAGAYQGGAGRRAGAGRA
jgi:hypothetical protein